MLSASKHASRTDVCIWQATKARVLSFWILDKLTLSRRYELNSSNFSSRAASDQYAWLTRWTWLRLSANARRGCQFVRVQAKLGLTTFPYWPAQMKYMSLSLLCNHARTSFAFSAIVCLKPSAAVVIQRWREFDWKCKEREKGFGRKAKREIPKR